MTDLTETSTFDAAVYEIQTVDPVQGGPGGIANQQAQALANRTRYLYNLIAALETTLAPLNSPALTGTPTAPTQAAGDNSTDLATDAFVQTALSGISTINCAGGANVVLTQPQWGCGILILTGAITANISVVFPTNASGRNRWIVFNRTTGAFAITCKTAAGTGVIVLQGAQKEVVGDGTNINASLSDFNNIALTGAPTAPTAAPGDNTTKLATTAFVAAVAALLAPLASPALTGEPTAPTPTAGDNSTNIATTSFVDTAITTNRLASVAYITASETWVVPAGVTTIRTRQKGGGGGGAGSNGTVPGGSGGAGAEAITTWTVTPGENVVIVIGAKGAKGAAGLNPGSNGGITTVNIGATTVTANGGVGGAVTSGSGAPGGIGGTATGGDLNLPGDDGTDGAGTTNGYNGGKGGAGWNGNGGGRAGASPTGGLGATAPGAGGGGAYGASLAGGDGFAGLVEIQW